jgi:hypothetical protein
MPVWAERLRDADFGWGERGIADLAHRPHDDAEQTD